MVFRLNSYYAEDGEPLLRLIGQPEMQPSAPNEQIKHFGWSLSVVEGPHLDGRPAVLLIVHSGGDKKQPRVFYSQTLDPYLYTSFVEVPFQFNPSTFEGSSSDYSIDYVSIEQQN